MLFRSLGRGEKRGCGERGGSRGGVGWGGEASGGAGVAAWFSLELLSCEVARAGGEVVLRRGEEGDEGGEGEGGL